MDEPRRSISSNRRLLIALIAVLAILQAGILVYLWTLLRPATPQEAAGPTPALPFQAPPATALTPTGIEPTLAMEETAGAPVRVVVGPPVPATNTTALARAFDEERALEHVAYLAGTRRRAASPAPPADGPPAPTSLPASPSMACSRAASTTRLCSPAPTSRPSPCPTGGSLRPPYWRSCLRRE